MEATFSYSGNAFFNKSFIRLVETDFLSNENGVFFIRYIFLLVESVTGIRGKEIAKKEFILASGELIL